MTCSKKYSSKQLRLSRRQSSVIFSKKKKALIKKKLINQFILSGMKSRYYLITNFF